MNKEQIKKYSIVMAIIFVLTYITASFVQASFILPHGGRFGVVLGTLFMFCIYVLVTESNNQP